MADELKDRVTRAKQMIAAMCSELRPPHMSIPPDRERDEDLFISDTLTMLTARIAELEQAAPDDAALHRKMLWLSAPAFDGLGYRLHISENARFAIVPQSSRRAAASDNPSAIERQAREWLTANAGDPYALEHVDGLIRGLLDHCQILQAQLRAAQAVPSVPKPPEQAAPSVADGDDEAEADRLAVIRFAVMLKAKLAKARAKGRSGWRDPAWPAADISRQMHEHMAKGDPLDVAAYAMFLALRGEATTAPQPTEPSDAEKRYATLQRMAACGSLDSIMSRPELIREFVALGISESNRRAELEQALDEAAELLRSTYSVAARSGANVDWPAFTTKIGDWLACRHSTGATRFNGGRAARRADIDPSEGVPVPLNQDAIHPHEIKP